MYYQECVFKVIDKVQARRDPIQDEIMSRVADRIYDGMRPS